MAYRAEILRSMGNKIGMTMGNLKILIWKIDDFRFGGEVRRRKGNLYSLGYHRDADNTFRPYSISVVQPSARTGRGGYIHIGAPGDEKQIKWYQDQYGLKTVEDTLFAIAEDILVEIAYIVFQFDSIKTVDKELLLGCVKKELFRREVESPPELVQDVWGLILQSMDSTNIRTVANVNVDLHQMAKRLLVPRKPFVELIRGIAWRNKSCDLQKFADYYEKFPMEVSSFYVIQIIRTRRCPEIIKYLKDAGYNLEGAIYSKIYFDPYDLGDYAYLKEGKIYTPEELKHITNIFIRMYAKANRISLTQTREKLGLVGI